MGLLDGLLGGVVGAEMATVVNGLIQRHGGLQGLLREFEQKGFGATVKSWVGTGPNQPISPAEVRQALGADAVSQLAAKVGLSPEELTKRLSQALPKAVDTMTPGGVIPQS
jgi:uncharacterized protein YidB (DUF937 family)